MICPECKSSSLATDETCGEIVCTSCGYVITEDLVSEELEYRSFGHEHVGRHRVKVENKIYPDRGLGSVITRIGRDIKGNVIMGSRQYQLYRLQKHQNRIKISGTNKRNLAQAARYLDIYTTPLNLTTPIREETMYIYRQLIEEDAIRGHTIKGMLTASVYMACRRLKIPRNLKTIARVSKIDKTTIARNYRKITKVTDVSVPVQGIRPHLDKLYSQFNVPGDTQLLGISILDKCEKLKITQGKSRQGIACAIFYLLVLYDDRLRVTQSDIVSIGGVTEVTLRNRYKEIHEQLGFTKPLSRFSMSDHRNRAPFVEWIEQFQES
jgi:transcription initiation factor TFIIB